MIDFPDAPVLDEEFIDPVSGATWKWDGAKWVGAGGGGAAPAYVLPPATTTELGGVMPDGVTITVDAAGMIASSGGGGGGGDYVLKTGDTMTGPLRVNIPGGYSLFLSGTSGHARMALEANGTGDITITGRVNALDRWQLIMRANSEAAGANAGGDLVIRAFNDTGGYIGEYLTIYRATGITNFTVRPTVAGVPIAMQSEVEELRAEIAALKRPRR